MPSPASSTEPRVPTGFHSWYQVASRMGIAAMSLSDLSQIHSASKLTEREFIIMRVVWPERQKIGAFPSSDGSELTDKARQMLQDFDEFKAYKDHIRNTRREISTYRKMGVFQLVRASQLEVKGIPKESLESTGVLLRRSPRNLNQFPSYQDMTRSDSGSSRPTALTAAAEAEGEFAWKTKDEQIVNDSLLSLLRALTINISGVRCQWTSARTPFDPVHFGDIEMVARTDGYLEGIGVPDIFSIVEVKSRIRDRQGYPQVLWQESAEMVAWIMHDTKENSRKCHLCRRLLISQDRDEIYLTLATYPQAYIQYLKGETATSLQDPSLQVQPSKNYSLLTMQEYGPWKIESPSHMHDLAKIVVSFCLEVTNDINEVKRKRSNP